MSFYTTRHVKKTRKECKCDWCREPINAGDPSVYISGLCEGDLFTFRYHPECRDATQRWYREYGLSDDYLPEERMNRGGIELYGKEEAK